MQKHYWLVCPFWEQVRKMNLWRRKYQPKHRLDRINLHPSSLVPHIPVEILNHILYVSIPSIHHTAVHDDLPQLVCYTRHMGNGLVQNSQLHTVQGVVPIYIFQFDSVSISLFSHVLWQKYRSKLVYVTIKGKSLIFWLVDYLPACQVSLISVFMCEFSVTVLKLLEILRIRCKITTITVYVSICLQAIDQRQVNGGFHMTPCSLKNRG